jgi:hypothetical protein
MVAPSSSSAAATAARRVCTRCIYDEAVPGIRFEPDGTCNYCTMIDGLVEQFQTGRPEGRRRLEAIVSQIKRDGRGRRYDCVIGVSGGTDSSHLIALAVDWGLRPLAVHYDNTWNTAIATQNIRKVLRALDVDLETHVVDNREIDDIFRAFLLADVPELDGSTDIALAETLYRAAARHGVRYILEGHSFLAEGVSPLGSAYVDGAYVRNLHRRFGSRPMRTFPNMTFAAFMRWTLVNRIKKIRPFWYLDYSKAAARAELERRFGWQYYGGHHLENRMTAFNHSVYFPVKFGIDQRNNSLGAAVRAGLISRDQALAEYQRPPVVEEDLVEYLKKRLRLDDVEYDRVMSRPGKTYRDYIDLTYKRRFERLRPLFRVMAHANLVPMSFYIKYTSPTET